MIRSLLIWLMFSVFCITTVELFAANTATFSVSNGQVYLQWDTSYNCTYTVLRSTIRGGYYSIIKEKLEEPRYVDTPEENEKTYYYAIEYVNKDSGEEENRTKEVGVYVP